MPLVNQAGLTSPSNSVLKDILGTTDKNNKTLLDLFTNKLAGTNGQASIGPNEKNPNTIVNLGAYRVDLQKYIGTIGQADRRAIFAVQQGGVIYAELFMPPNQGFTTNAVEVGFTASLQSHGTQRFDLP